MDFPLLFRRLPDQVEIDAFAKLIASTLHPFLEKRPSAQTLLGGAAKVGSFSGSTHLAFHVEQGLNEITTTCRDASCKVDRIAYPAADIVTTALSGSICSSSMRSGWFLNGWLS
ncbi:hypothetical protein BCY86_03250 [Pajaroellobacter abortibovis]|uniref:Uncharacterized protein n=1 Tax=Pajaroellobacter abortibovis TaxID=1882918 RepID=A0A1L6MWA5_9BACT|nr:hypothetical protein BCY86_03250 [Pajaroellobacter abortibovis]